ncbi:MAG: endonuclease [Chitinophagaceae bacterium]|nr:endonuclease [Chitinophagaceae bacterium]MBP6047385.1 endonuclease [Ferruginibacter sp.]MBK7090014.1 endonuclease [Chitinophagaceae bacterium]MBP6371565.1 endonuclease [Ferruginibacter sp.]MBP6987757.1 endonuclease [Ferruginibacter sp.]
MKKTFLANLLMAFAIVAQGQIPNGFYNAASGLSCQNLKTVLKNITNTDVTQLSYTPGVWNAYQYTDIKPGTGNVIWDIYTDDNNPSVPETYSFIYGSQSNGGNQCGNYSQEGDCYNREHTTPQSWFGSASPMYSDVQLLLPTDGYVNGRKSNYPFGNVTSYTYKSIDNESKLGTGASLNFGYSGTVFMPFAAFKGDVARIALYVATRYEDQIIANNWYQNSSANEALLSPTDESNAAMRRLQIYDDWFLRTMFQWMQDDPVSQKEIDRNNAVYYQSGQHNRNPFVDHPEYAALIWQCTGLLPVTLIDFSAAKNNNDVLLQWTATQETNFKVFEIERSIDGIHYYKIGEITGQNLSRYNFTDRQLPAASVVYYRLKMIDIDGKFHYSGNAIVRINNNISDIVIYPNPTSQGINIKLTEKLLAGSQLMVFDASGRKVKEQAVRANEVNINVDVKQLTQGKYFIRINNPSQVINGSFTIYR